MNQYMHIPFEAAEKPKAIYTSDCMYVPVYVHILRYVPTHSLHPGWMMPGSTQRSVHLDSLKVLTLPLPVEMRSEIL